VAGLVLIEPGVIVGTKTGKLNLDIVRDYPVGARLGKESGIGKGLHCNVLRHFISSYGTHEIELQWSNGDKNSWTAVGVAKDLQAETLEF